MPKFRNRGEAAEDCVRRWLAIESENAQAFGDEPSRLSMRQLRRLKNQVREAIVRWESQQKEG